MTVSLTSSLLQTQYKLNTSVSTTQTLLSGDPGNFNPNSILQTQNSATAFSSPEKNSIDMLGTFITENISDNKKLLGELEAVTALSTMLEGGISEEAFYINSYEKALLLGNEEDNSIGGMLKMLLA